MKKTEAIELLKKEIEWCKENPQNMPEDWRDGFVNGLKQAIRIVKTARFNVSE